MPKINPNILIWARETAKLRTEAASKKLQIKPTTLIALESGEKEPTRPMLLKMAKHYRRPLLTFYLSAPPRQGDRGQDFRTLPDSHSVEADALLDALIRNIRARQSMTRAVLEDEEAEPLPFVGSVSMDNGVRGVLASMKDYFRIDINQFRAQINSKEAFKFLRSKLEDKGIFILLINNLGSYHSTIDLETFRGFAVADEIAPFIVINDQDSDAALSFTLIHELVHICLGQTGVSGELPEQKIEKFCNDIASEFLLPNEELIDISGKKSREEIENEISEFARSRNLSSSMVAYKLFRKGSIDQNTWFELRKSFKKKWFDWRSKNRKKTKEKEGGPSYYVLRRNSVGSSLISLVRRMMAEGALTTTKAGKILGVSAKNVQTLVEPQSPNLTTGRAV